MKHTKEPWRLGPITPDNTITQISAVGWTGFASVVIRMKSEMDISIEGRANAERIIKCVNAMAGIEDPQKFRENADVSHNAERMWETKMMELLGEDGIVSVTKAINDLKAKAFKTELTGITETDRDNLCDIVWWMKGYKRGNDNSLNGSDFCEDHLQTLDKIIRSLRELLNKQNHDRKI